MSVRCWLSLSLLWVLCKNCQVRVFEKIVEFCWSFQTIFLSFVFKHFQNYLILRRYIGLILNRQIIFHFRYYVNRGSFINEWFLVLQTNHQPLLTLLLQAIVSVYFNVVGYLLFSVCSANQPTGFCIMGTLIVKGLT